MMERPHSERLRGLIMDISHDVLEVVLFQLNRDPEQQFSLGTLHWARENGLEDWEAQP